MTARALMVQGTASGVGKSVFVTGLCRLLCDAGVSVAPFKAINMALNSSVTTEGLEIGRAQAVQAEAAGVEPTVAMNPVLLKPDAGWRCQVVLQGRPVGTVGPRDGDALRTEVRAAIEESLNALMQKHDVLLIEGSGSPAEINLKGRDLANMFVARLARAPVVLVGDIDRGGVFASLLGTLELLEPDERERIIGLVINRLRGEAELLRPGVDQLEQRCGIPVLGVVPHMEELRIADEDSAPLDDRSSRLPRGDELDVAVVRLPHLSNHDDVAALDHEPGVMVRFVDAPEPVRTADLVVLPGTKATVHDLTWLRRRGIASALAERARVAAPVLGICGGAQMLGETIEDPCGVESGEGVVEGLGLIPLRTCFGFGKRTARVRGRVRFESLLGSSSTVENEIEGYEIHSGSAEPTDADASPVVIDYRDDEHEGVLDGACDESRSIVGTMLHGVLENDCVRDELLAKLRRHRGIPAPSTGGWSAARRDAEYDRLAEQMWAHLDVERLQRLLIG